MTRRTLTTVTIVTLLLSLYETALIGQDQSNDKLTPVKIEVDPAELNMQVGESTQLNVTVTNVEGTTLDVPLLFIPLYGQFWNLETRTWGFNLFKVSKEGLVTASRPGDYHIRIRVPLAGQGENIQTTTLNPDERFLQVNVPLSIQHPPVKEVLFISPPEHLYTETTVRLNTKVVDESDGTRTNIPIRFTSSSPDIAQVDALGYITGTGQGEAKITASAETISAHLTVNVLKNPVTSMTIAASTSQARTGDVIHLTATPYDNRGHIVQDLQVVYSFHAKTDDLSVGGPTSGLIDQSGRFVADLPGEYTIVANAGNISDTLVLSIRPRNVKQTIELIGHGRVSDRGTSDLWVWEGPDGRDYAITGTHRAEGHAYIWDVTEPGHPVIIDIVRVDARTVNDVKVSEDGRIAVISREGASNRRNGIVILDVSNPQEGVKIISRFTDELTGGVHNVFVYDNHVYALSAGQRYDIINIEDPKQPHRVGRFELDNFDRSIHDIWVKDGIAYSANWNDGVVMVDVGGGNKGGTPQDPIKMGNFSFPTGWNHAVYPYRSQSTGKFYVFAGDEASRTSTRYSPITERGTGTPGYQGEPSHWRGWIHILEWSDSETSKIVARYEVPEAGSHNIWIEDDVMYVAFYNGGLRIVDISGELMGNLYRQGREIARFLPFDPEGFVPNAPQVWGAQPHKGNIFFSDYNSGLWVVRLSEHDTESVENLNHSKP